MVLESTMICVDDSDYMRNGDFLPTRIQAQQEAVNLLAIAKLRSNPESNIGLLKMAKPYLRNGGSDLDETCVEVLSTLTTDSGKIMNKLHQMQPDGNINFLAAVRVAHLALKHRQGKNHRMRILIFVGSPVEDEEKEIVKVAKKLKKEKVSVDVINFGEEAVNTEKLTAFINTINGKDGTGCHLVTVPPGPLLSDALLTSPVVAGEDGAGPVPGMGSGGFEFGIDPNEDPELALALRVSMEEERARQEQGGPKPATESAASDAADTRPVSSADPGSEEALLEQAIAMSINSESSEAGNTPTIMDFGSMTEEEQIAFAMRMSLAESGMDTEDNTPTPMDTDGETPKPSESEGDINDPEYLRSVLENLPGVDPQNEDIQRAIGSLVKKDDEKKEDKDKK